MFAALLAIASVGRADAVYRWTDAEGVIHISSEKPPPGVKAERIVVGGSSSTHRSGGTSSGAGSSASRTRASPAQVAEREQVLGNLRTRECVVALEALDRLTSGTQPTSAAEIHRLQQTAQVNCSSDPARRREQEELAAQLRVANSPACIAARSSLADLLAPGAQASRERVKAQQDFVDAHCKIPFR